MTRFSCDVYRTDDTILIHQRSGRFSLVHLMLFLFFTLMSWVFLSFYLKELRDPNELAKPDAFLGFWILFSAGFALFSLFSIPFQYFKSLTIRIDPETVRYDYRSLCFRRSLAFRRTAAVRLTTNATERENPLEYALALGDDARSISWTLSDRRELLWLSREIQTYLETVSVAVAVGDPPKVSFADAECGLELLSNKSFHGKPLLRTIPPTELVAEKSETETPGRIEVRCGRCNRVVPPENVDPDAAISVCEQCGAIRRLVDLLRFPAPHGSRYSCWIEGNTLQIRKYFNNEAYSLLAYVWFFFAVSLFLLLTAYLEAPLIFAGVGLIFLAWSIWMITDRVVVHITPEKCRITRIPCLIPFTEEIPREDLYKAVRERSWIPNRDVVRLYYRGGSVDLETVIPGYDSQTLGRLNHYLFTVPPAHPKPGSARVYLGGCDADTQEVKPYCPDCGLPISTGEFDLAQQRGTCERCGREFRFSETSIMSFPDAMPPTSKRLKIEKGDRRLRIDWCPETWSGKEWKGLRVIAFFFLFLIFTQRSSPLVSKSFDPYDFLSFAAPLLVMFSIFFLFAFIRGRTQWTILFDRDKLEISYRFWFWRDKRTIPREKIACFSLYEKSRDDSGQRSTI